MSEFLDLFGEWGLHTDGSPTSLSVETRLGISGDGEKFAAAETVTGLPVLYGLTLVRDSDGNEQTSTASVYADLGATADRFTLGSRVRIDGGDPRTVIAVGSPDVYGLFGFRVVNLT